MLFDVDHSEQGDKKIFNSEITANEINQLMYENTNVFDNLSDCVENGGLFDNHYEELLELFCSWESLALEYASSNEYNLLLEGYHDDHNVLGQGVGPQSIFVPETAVEPHVPPQPELHLQLEPQHQWTGDDVCGGIWEDLEVLFTTPDKEKEIHDDHLLRQIYNDEKPLLKAQASFGLSSNSLLGSSSLDFAQLNKFACKSVAKDEAEEQNTHELTHAAPIEKLRTKRKIVQPSSNLNIRVKNYIQRYSAIVQEVIEEKEFLFQNEIFRIVPESVWKPHFFSFQLPNHCNTTTEFDQLFEYDKTKGDWLYFQNLQGQPMLSLWRKELPMRHCKQIGNFYEPYIIRERRKDGKLMTLEEIELRIRSHKEESKRKDDSTYYVEALCPYCFIDREHVVKRMKSAVRPNTVAAIDDYFYGRNNSEYLHHVTKHHGVYSDGTEHDLPKLVIADKKGRYFTYCELCNEIIKIKKIANNDDNFVSSHKFLSYLRHCLKHSNHSKNGNGQSRYERKQKIIRNANTNCLLYEK